MATNIIQKCDAVHLGSLYASKKASELTTEQLKDMLENEDKSVLRSLYCFSNKIKGSQQFFSGWISKSVNYLRHQRIMSQGKDMFNLFLTFGLADLHERLLHEKFPKEYTKGYLKKIVVKDMSEVLEDADRDDYIDEKTDYELRLKAINDNSDICNAHLIKKVELFWKTHLKTNIWNEILYQEI